jgi:hypothetical protein
MSEKKVVGRRVFIALEIVCIILLACLVGATSLYQWQINDKDNTITNLQNQLIDLTNIVDMDKYATWASDQTINQTVNSYNSWTEETNYAGFVAVQVLSSTTDKTYVEVIYSYYIINSNYGINYDQRIAVGSSGVATFPIEPSYIEIRVGNSNLINGANETVTITYYY